MDKEKKKIRWRRIVMSMAGLVVFWTVYALILPASTLTQSEKKLVCPANIHSHTDECYDECGTLICGKADFVVHVHEADCFDESGNVVCQLPQILEHEHSEDCYEERLILQCLMEEHTHTDECYELSYLCDEEHEHTEECEAGSVLVCEVSEHTHAEECYETEKVLTCTSAEIVLHVHNDECYDDEHILVCDKLEIESHQHGNGCFEEVFVSDVENVNEDMNEEGTVTQHVDVLALDEDAENGSEEWCETVESNPDGNAVEESISEENDNTEEAREEAVAENANTEKLNQDVAKEEIKEVVTRTYTGRDFAITVQTTQETQIPINSTLSVAEIMPGTEEYAECYREATASLVSEEQQMVFARFFDISFVVNGSEVEPQAPVSVIIAYQNRVEIPEGEQNVLHFDSSGNVLNVEMCDPASSNAGEDAFVQACYSEENAFAFEADSFSVWGTTIVRTYKSGKVTALCAERKITSYLTNDGTDIGYEVRITPDHVNEVKYEISTCSDVETDTLIPVVGSDGTDGVSLYSPELQVKKNDQILDAGACFNNLYCREEDEYIRVAYLKPEGDDLLIPYDEDGQRLNGSLYMVHDVQQVQVEWGVKNLSVIIDAEKYNSGVTKQDSIIQFDVLGDPGATYVKDAYTVKFRGYAGDVFRLSDYFVGDEFYYRVNSGNVNANTTGYTNNSGSLVPCQYIKIIQNNGKYEMWPCDRNGDAVANATLYTITDTLYQFSFKVNNMVKEHGEDDGQAYFWAGTDFRLGTNINSTLNTVHSLSEATVDYYANDRSSSKYTFDISDVGLTSTSINQDTYYIIGHVGESMLPAEASKDGAVLPGQKPTDPMTAILYVATGSKTRVINATTWDASWRGTHDYNNVHQESYPGWHTAWMGVGEHASDNGWRGYNYYIRDYLVLDSSWDKMMNFIITEEDGKVILNAQKFDDPTLYPFTQKTTSTTRVPSSNARRWSGNTLVGYGEGDTALQLIYARPGIITQRWYRSGLPATQSGNLPTYAKMDHVQLRVNTNVVIDINDIKYEGSFLYVSGSVSPFGKKASTDTRWTYLVAGSNATVSNLTTARNGNYWVSLPIANSQESKGQDLRTDIVPQGFDNMWDPALVNIAIKYELAGVLKPIDPETGKVNEDANTWILYCDDSFNPGAYNGDQDATQVLKDIAEAQGASGSVKEAGFEYVTTLDGAQLQQSTFACPRTAGYDVILDVNAAFKEIFASLPKIVITKQWEDAGFEAYRPDTISVMIERHKKGTDGDRWEEFRELTFTGIINDFNWVGSYVLRPNEKPEEYDAYRIQPGSEKMTWNGERNDDVHYTYEATYDGLYVTNRAVNPYVAMEGYKIWENSKGGEMALGDIPDSIILNLYQSEVPGELGLLFDSRIIKKKDQQNEKYWFWTFGELEKFFVGEDGKLHEYNYTIAEVRANDQSGYEVLHEYTGQLAGGQLVEGAWKTISLNEIVEGDGNIFVFKNQRKPVIAFRKVDLNGQPLQGAMFTLKEQEREQVLYSFISDAQGYLIREEENGKVRTLELDKDKTYVLTETKAPVGYTILTDSITIKYDSGQKQWICTYVDIDSTKKYIKTMPSEDGDLLTISVINIGIKLPETGGSGTKVMSAIGGILLVVSSLMFIGLKRKRRCE